MAKNVVQSYKAPLFTITSCKKCPSLSALLLAAVVFPTTPLALRGTHLKVSNAASVARSACAKNRLVEACVVRQESTATDGALAWVDAGGAGRRVGPEGVLGFGKIGGGVVGACGFFTASGIRSGPEGTCQHHLHQLGMM